MRYGNLSYASGLIMLASFFIGVMNSHAQEGGYANTLSVAKGDSISFCVSTKIAEYDGKFYRWGADKNFVEIKKKIFGSEQLTRDSAYMYGCGWQPSVVMKIPETWASGVYTFEFPTSAGTASVLFVVTEPVKGTLSKTVMFLSANTWQAYNNYGGKSLYESNSTGGKRSYKVSFSRPFGSQQATGQYFNWERKLLAWLEQNAVPVEILTNLDLTKDPRLLDNYDVAILVGHDEYWTRPVREKFETFVKTGRRLIILSGNTCWWQVRFEDGTNTMVCYKDSTLDPLTGYTDSLVTVNWSARPVNYPENLLTGVSFRKGGFVNYGEVLPKSAGYGDYAVYNSHHWVYRGTGSTDGNQFGFNSDVVGYETDGAIFNWRDGIPMVTGTDRSPLNYTILGISPAANLDKTMRGHGTMGVYYSPSGGVVFNAATTDWVDGLSNDPIVQRITLNVLNRFKANQFPPEIVSWYPFRVISDSINHESVYLNRREFLMSPGDSLQFAIHTSDPYFEPLHFSYTKDGQVVARDSTYTYYATAEDKNNSKVTITANVYNNHDTSAISWELYYSPLKILSSSERFVLQRSRYYYKLDVLNYYHDSVRYELLDAPTWLSMDGGGVVTGIAPIETGIYSVTVSVRNGHNDVDTQKYFVRVIDTTTYIDVERRIPELKLLQNYPNPFNPRTTVEFQLGKISSVRLLVFNVLGQLVRTLVEGVEYDIGWHDIIWNGSDDNGKTAGSGVYLLRLEALPKDGSRIQVETKKTLLLK